MTEAADSGDEVQVIGPPRKSIEEHVRHSMIAELPRRNSQESGAAVQQGRRLSALLVGGPSAPASLEAGKEAGATVERDAQDTYEEHLGEDFRDTPWVQPSRELAKRCGVVLHLDQVPDWLCCCGIRTSPARHPDGRIWRGEIHPHDQHFNFSQNVSQCCCGIRTSPACHTNGRIWRGLYDCTGDCSNRHSDQIARLSELSAQVLTSIKQCASRQPATASEKVCFDQIHRCVQVFQKNINTYKQQADDENVTVADYSVFVRGLPEDADEEGVIKHFSELFRLDKESWSSAGGQFGWHKKLADKPEDIKDAKGRSIGSMLQPVQSTAHSRFDHLCLDSWVAEVVIAHPERQFINTARKLQTLSGAAARAEKELEALMVRMGQNADKLEGSATKFEAASWKCNCAFVVFDHEESYRRCLNDYNNFTGSAQPAELRYKGRHVLDVHAVKCDMQLAMTIYPSSMCAARGCVRRGRHILDVQPATEPGNVLWENLEITVFQRRRELTATCTLTVYRCRQSHCECPHYETDELRQASISRMCRQGLSVFLCRTVVRYDRLRMFGTFLVTIGLLVLSFGLSSSSSSAKKIYDDAMPSDNICFNKIPATLGAADTTVPAIYVQRSIGYTTDQGLGTCPATTTYITVEGVDEVAANQANACAEPCVSPDNKLNEKCIVGGKAIYGTKDVNNCFCRQEIKSAIDLYGTMSGGRYIMNTYGHACNGAAWLYIQSQVLLLLASAVIIIINMVVKSVMKVMTATEGHDTITGATLSTTGKLASTLFANTFIVTMIVNAYIAADVPLLKNDAGSRDFDFSWYHTAGASLIVVMAVNVISPHATVIVGYLVIAPLKRLFAMTAITQSAMNKAYEGPQFDLSARLPFVLNTLAVTMVLSPALPLLLPLAMIAFAVTYMHFSHALLRAAMAVGAASDDDADDAQVNAKMPAVLFLHCAFAIWVYAEPTIFDSAYIYGGGHYLEQIKAFWRIVTHPGAVSADTVSQDFNPEFTGTFARLFPPGKKVPEQFIENAHDGWTVTVDPDSCEVLRKQYQAPVLSPRNSAGAAPAHKTGDMLTWEVLKEVYGICTYHMSDNKAYADIVRTQDMLVQELNIVTPKCPGGKLWSEEGYRNYLAVKAGETPALTPGGTAEGLTVACTGTSAESCNGACVALLAFTGYFKYEVSCMCIARAFDKFGHSSANPNTWEAACDADKGRKPQKRKPKASTPASAAGVVVKRQRRRPEFSVTSTALLVGPEYQIDPANIPPLPGSPEALSTKTERAEFGVRLKVHGVNGPVTLAGEANGAPANGNGVHSNGGDAEGEEGVEVVVDAAAAAEERLRAWTDEEKDKFYELMVSHRKNIYEATELQKQAEMHARRLRSELLRTMCHRYIHTHSTHHSAQHVIPHAITHSSTARDNLDCDSLRLLQRLQITVVLSTKSFVSLLQQSLPSTVANQCGGYLVTRASCQLQQRQATVVLFVNKLLCVVAAAFAAFNSGPRMWLVALCVSLQVQKGMPIRRPCSELLQYYYAHLKSRTGAADELKYVEQYKDLKAKCRRGGDHDPAAGEEDCYVCQIYAPGMKLLCCDGCPNVCHISCAGLTEGPLPEGDWFCAQCQEKQQQRQQQEEEEQQQRELEAASAGDIDAETSTVAMDVGDAPAFDETATASAQQPPPSPPLERAHIPTPGFHIVTSGGGGGARSSSPASSDELDDQNGSSGGGSGGIAAGTSVPAALALAAKKDELCERSGEGGGGSGGGAGAPSLAAGEVAAVQTKEEGHSVSSAGANGNSIPTAKQEA
ncbi:hypothetical protein JKP88DRAFT_267824 [Tribonema minus]|uniref:PHD-type domain-containing protein n=1 Tax=Tribonema minus TaxID=303371 RepID=A0A835Z625_9STRA|nr:hypothetical protein JKP88DRAFT_267824 [Tribonema minus]